MPPKTAIKAHSNKNPNKLTEAKKRKAASNSPETSPSVRPQRRRAAKKRRRRDDEDVEETMDSNHGDDEGDVMSTPRSSQKKRRDRQKETVQTPPTENSDGRSRSAIVPEIEQGVLFSPVYDSFWSHTDEKNLRGRWSADDEYFAYKVSDSEVALWRKCADIFKCYPPHLLPKGVRVSIAGKKNGMLINPATNTTRLDRSWSQDFCLNFGKLITIPPLRGRILFVRHALHRALELRVNDTSLAPHTKTSESIDYDDWENPPQEVAEVLQYINDNIASDLEPEKLDGLKLKVFQTRAKPEHWDFLEYLEKTVKPGNKVIRSNLETTHLELTDIRSILSAWDKYVEKEQPTLLTVHAYFTRYNQDNSNKGFESKNDTTSRQRLFVAWKKNYELDLRREVEREQKIGRVSVSTRNGETEEQEVESAVEDEEEHTPPPTQPAVRNAEKSKQKFQILIFPKPYLQKGGSQIEVPVSQAGLNVDSDDDGDGFGNFGFDNDETVISDSQSQGGLNMSPTTGFQQRDSLEFEDEGSNLGAELARFPEKAQTPQRVPTPERVSTPGRVVSPEIFPTPGIGLTPKRFLTPEIAPTPEGVVVTPGIAPPAQRVSTPEAITNPEKPPDLLEAPNIERNPTPKRTSHLERSTSPPKTRSPKSKRSELGGILASLKLEKFIEPYINKDKWRFPMVSQPHRFAQYRDQPSMYVAHPRMSTIPMNMQRFADRDDNWQRSRAKDIVEVIPYHGSTDFYRDRGK